MSVKDTIETELAKFQGKNTLDVHDYLEGDEVLFPFTLTCNRESLYLVMKSGTFVVIYPNSDHTAAGVRFYPPNSLLAFRVDRDGDHYFTIGNGGTLSFSIRTDEDKATIKKAMSLLLKKY